MNFSWAIDLDPKGASNQYKETIDPAASCYPVEDDQINNNPQETGSKCRLVISINVFWKFISLFDFIILG